MGFESIKIKKNFNPFGVSQYINRSIETAIEANKTAFAEGKAFSDACWQIVFAIDNVERVIKGCGVLDENSTEYLSDLKKFSEEMKAEKFDLSNTGSDNAIRAVKIAQYKFQLLIAAVRSSEPSEFELII